jgi:hypothetical protein
MVEQNLPPERPRAEPEIIPPDHGGGRSPWRGREFTDFGATHRIYVSRLGPFGGILLVLALVVLAVLGALLIWIPIVAFIALVATLSGVLRLRR